MTKHEATVLQFGRALARLEEILTIEKTDIVRDSAVKRFELTYDASWKAVKAALELQSVKCVSPRNCIEEAFRVGLLDAHPIWKDMVRLRNDTVHAYDVEVAERVYEALPVIIPHFRALHTRLQKE